MTRQPLLAHARILLAGTLLLLAGTATAKPAVATKDEGDVLKGLVQTHPRLLLTRDRLAALKKLHATDPALQRIIREALADADKQLTKHPLRHVLPDGKRLLDTSRDCLARTLALGFAYRWTGDRKYADKGIENLRTVCAFEDWNPNHFLDTAEMSNAVGIGYDWLYEAMDPATRETVRKGLIKNGLNAKDPKQAFAWVHNWNMVCNGGLTVGALAVADTDPDLARRIIERSLKYLPLATVHYAPDGAWMEGPNYWHYATSYTIFMCAALDSAVGRNFGIDQTPGLDKSGYFTIYTAGPTGQFLCFADAGKPNFNEPRNEPFTRLTMACLFWLARKYGNPDFSDAEYEILARRSATALHAVWYQPPTGKAPGRTLDRFFDGPVPLFFMRGSWSDPDTLWCGVKGGFNKVNHGHLDLGNFEIEAGGVRWVMDLGADGYNIPGYFGKQRWSYFRVSSESHNVPLINGKPQLLAGTAKVLKVHPNQEDPSITLDLSAAYGKPVQKVIRTVAMAAKRSKIIVTDQFTLTKPAEILWGVTTDAEIEIRTGGVAWLTRNGKSFSATILEPAGTTFAVASAEQKPPQYENKGIRRLQLKLAAPVGTSTVKIQFSPVP